MLEFRTLGAIDLRGNDGQRIASVLQHSKRLALLAYLCASHPPKLHRRDTLAALLWPDLDEAHARGALRQELSRLRQSLGPGVLVGAGQEAVTVDARGLWCDASAFEDALDSGRLADAVELWRGEFLPGLHVDGGEFERWLDHARDRLCRKVIDAVCRLVAQAEAEGDLPRAVAHARRLTELAPYDETGWQSLIGLLDRSGDRAGALAAYDALAARLRAELDVVPSPETRAMIERVRDRAEPLTVIDLLPVENQTGDRRLDALARRLTDRLARGIAGPQFANVTLGGKASKATAEVSAAMYPRGELVEVGARIAEPGEDGRIVAVAEPVLVNKDTGDGPLDTLVARVVVLLALHYDQRAVAPGRAALAKVPSLESYLEYLRGADFFGDFQFVEAAQHLRRAYEVDPCHVRAAIFASIALAYGGKPAEADSLVTSALAAGEPLPAYERGFGRWFLAALHGRRVEAYRAALDMLSLTRHHVFRMIAAWEAANMNLPREALRLLPDPHNLGVGWWRKWVGTGWELQASERHILKEHEGELAVALAGRAMRPESFDTIRTEIRARAAGSQAEEVLRLLAKALTLAPGELTGLPPVPTTPADVAWTAAAELDAHGQQLAAAKARETGLRWIASRPGPTRADKLLEARLRLEAGDAETAFQTLAGLAPYNDLESIVLVGLVAGARDDDVTARGVIARLEALQNPYVSGRHLLLAAGIRAALKEPDAAVETLRDAFAAGLPYSVELHAHPMLRPLAEREDFEELLRPRD